MKPLTIIFFTMLFLITLATADISPIQAFIIGAIPVAMLGLNRWLKQRAERAGAQNNDA